MSSLSSVGNAQQWWRPIGDIEGLPQRWLELLRDQTIKVSSDGHATLADDSTNLSFEGDLWKRGPYGIRSVTWTLDLLRQDPERVRLSMGNHDGNTLQLLQWMPAMSLNQFSEFNEWRTKNNRENNEISQIDFWADRNGVFDKINWFWLESVADKMGVDPTDAGFKAEMYPDGKILLDKLAKHISKEQVYKKFLKFISPGGALWEVLEKSHMIDFWRTKSGVSFFSTHSGIDTKGNFMIVPGDQRKAFDIAFKEVTGLNVTDIDSDVRALIEVKNSQLPDGKKLHFEAAMYHPDEVVQVLTKIKGLEMAKIRQIYIRAFEVWSTNYSEFQQSNLQEIKNLWKEFRDTKKWNSFSEETRLTKAQAMLSNRMGALTDAGWDPKLKKINIEANSPIYPDASYVKGNSIPGLPDTWITKFMALAGIEFRLGGHQPIGDFAVHRISEYFGRVVQFVLTDTSFSPIEQQDFIRIREDGFLQFRARTRDGLVMAIDRPGSRDYQKLRAHALKYMKNPAKYPELKAASEQYNALDILGKTVNGWLVAGFAGKKDPATGRTVPDYTNFILFQKQGRNMNYQLVDTWGIFNDQSKGEFIGELKGKVRLAEADFETLAADAKKEKALEVQATEATTASGNQQKRQVLSDEQFFKILEGKNLVISSGPALNSLNKALKFQEAQGQLTAHLIEFEAWLRSRPATEEFVFLGGGTLGFEQLRNEVIAKVNAERKSNGLKPHIIIGSLASISGSSEFDPNVRLYHLLEGAYYWNDYFPKLMKLLLDRPNFKLKSFHVDFAGGGAILGDQIKLVENLIKKGANLIVNLIDGLSPEQLKNLTSVSECKGCAATDAYIATKDGQEMLSSGKMSIWRQKYKSVIDRLGIKKSTETTKEKSAGFKELNRPQSSTSKVISCEAVFGF